MNVFVKVMMISGVPLSLKQKIQSGRQFTQAANDDRLFILEKDRNAIGFFTWDKTQDGVFMNNMFILPTFRNKSNLLYIRKIFRGAFPDAKKFYWKNRKHDRQHIVRGRCYEKTTV